MILRYRWVRFIILLVAIPLYQLIRYVNVAWDLSYEEISDL